MPPPPKYFAELELYWACTLPLLCKPSPFVEKEARQWLGWLPKPCHAPTASGFTLAELLICLAILGVIATFTIPKIIVAQTNGQDSANAREFIGALSSAYQLYQSQNGPAPTSLAASNLASYLNFIGTTTTSIDDMYEGGTQTCSSTSCFKTHTGAVVRLIACYFNGTGSTNSIWMLYDPDGVVTDGTTNGPGKSLFIILYYNGRITSYGQKVNNPGNTCGTYSTAHPDPPWFSW